MKEEPKVERGEPTSGLEPLTCSLRVIIQVLLGFAWGCKYRIDKPLSLLWFALCCTVIAFPVVSECYQYHPRIRAPLSSTSTLSVRWGTLASYD